MKPLFTPALPINVTGEDPAQSQAAPYARPLTARDYRNRDDGSDGRQVGGYDDDNGRRIAAIAKAKRDGTFAKLQEEYNRFNSNAKTRRVMDESGRITEYDEQTWAKLAEARQKADPDFDPVLGYATKPTGPETYDQANERMTGGAGRLPTPETYDQANQRMGGTIKPSGGLTRAYDVPIPKSKARTTPARAAASGMMSGAGGIARAFGAMTAPSQGMALARALMPAGSDQRRMRKKEMEAQALERSNQVAMERTQRLINTGSFELGA